MEIVYFLASSLLGAFSIVAIVSGFQAWRMMSPGGRNTIWNGPWSTRLSEGSERRGIFQRAVVALVGLWALRSTEVIYFTAMRDSDGNRLRMRQTYQIMGNDLPARWWSITAYRNFQFIPNPLNRYSFSTSSVEREGFNGDNNAWTINLSTDPQQKNWVPLTNRRGILVISLRLYNPTSAAFQGPGTIDLPRIVRVRDCA